MSFFMELCSTKLWVSDIASVVTEKAHSRCVYRGAGIARRAEGYLI